MSVLTGDVYVASYSAPGGSPLAGATVAVTVTRPDGSTATPAATVSGSTATAAIPAPQVGDYLLVWSVSGTVTDIEVDQFTAIAPRLQLLNLADLRDELNLTTADAGLDVKLRRWLAAAAHVVENICGPVLQATRTDVFDGETTSVTLPFRWVRAITSITETRGTTNYPLTEQPLGASVDAFGYTWDRTINKIVRRGYGGGVVLFPPGEQVVTVSYLLGMVAIPLDIQKATAKLIGHWYQQDEAPGQMTVGYPGEGGEVSKVGGYLVPNAVMELLTPWARRPGIF